jgi:hypothetical protein
MTKTSQAQKRKVVNRTKAKRYYTFSTRLKYEERNSFLRYCREAGLTPSEVIRNIVLDKIKNLKFLEGTI